MLSDDEDFFTNRATGGAARVPQNRNREATPNPFADHPDIDIDLDLDLPGVGRSEVNEETPLQQLIRYWMNERHAPDILPVQQALLANLLDTVRKQSDVVKTLQADPSFLDSEEDHFRTILVQTEIERVKFIVRSYVRTRLFKIEKYARWILLNEEVQGRLSATERDHAQRHANLTENHLYQSVLQSLPPAQASLDDAPAFVPPMVTGPDMTLPVFVHAREDCPPIRLPDGKTLEMEKGDILLTHYAVVEQLVARGEAELV